MSAATLKLRSDLIVSPQDGSNGAVFVIKDPVTERFFRFKEAEHFIAQQLDGATSPDTVRQRVTERFGMTLSAENLEQFVSRLRVLGLVNDGAVGSGVGPRPRRRIAGDFLYLRFRIFDPDRLLDRMLPRVRWLFTPYFLASSAALVLIAVGITVGHWAEIFRQFREMFRWESLLLAWFISLAVITAHEFSHGLTCKYFGGRVREIGFMLIYFQPAFYCNVSDAWLFPEKSKRLWVTFAGGYFEIFLWALATLLWRVTDPNTVLNHLALVVTATSAVRQFFNMNPLIKLDGYYLLSDYLGIPNLRQKAVGYWSAGCKRLLGLGLPASGEISPRERRIYRIYGLLAATYSYWLLGIIMFAFGGYLVREYQAWGFVFFATALGTAFRRPLRRALAGVRAGLESAESRARSWKKLPKIIVGLAAAGLILYFWRLELKVSGEFTILPIRKAEVRAQVEGMIQEIARDEGDQVSAGDLLVRLGDRDYRSELIQTQAEMEEKAARLKLLRAGPRPEEIDLVRTGVAKTDERLKYAHSELERVKALTVLHLLSQRDLEQAEEQLAIREKERQEAEEQLKLLQAGSRVEEIEALEAVVNRLAARHAFLEEQLRLLAIPSPVSGVITTRKLKEKVGQHVPKGELIAEVHAVRRVTAEVAIPEKEIGDVALGQSVRLKARAYPHKNFHGTVVAIAPIATKPEPFQDQRTVLVTTEIDNASFLLKPEMSGLAKIYCGQCRAGELLFRRFVRYLRVEFWSWW